MTCCTEMPHQDETLTSWAVPQEISSTCSCVRCRAMEWLSSPSCHQLVIACLLPDHLFPQAGKAAICSSAVTHFFLPFYFSSSLLLLLLLQSAVTQRLCCQRVQAPKTVNTTMACSVCAVTCFVCTDMVLLDLRVWADEDDCDDQKYLTVQLSLCNTYNRLRQALVCIMSNVVTATTAESYSR